MLPRTMASTAAKVTALTFLGTSSGAPSRTRNVTSHIVHFSNGRQWLLDCGEGTQQQIIRCAVVKKSRVDVILITHMHGDHTFGLPGLLCSMGLAGHESPVTIFGPVGISQFIRTALSLTRTEGENLAHELHITEMEPNKHYDFGMVHGFHLSAHPISHSIPCHGYVIREPDRRGKVDKDKIQALGVQGKDIRKLTEGETVTLPSGTVVNPDDVMGPTQKGRSFVLLGDTCDPSGIAEAARDCDTLVHECTYEASMQDKALKNGHSTSEMAGQFAQKINAKRLILTHFSARYDQGEKAELEGSSDASDPGSAGEVREDDFIGSLVAEASAQCPAATVVAARDFLTVPL